MTFFSRLFGNAPALSSEQTQRIAQWSALGKADLRIPFDAARYVVVDVETSGLSPKEDSLIAIGAVSVQQGNIMLKDTFEVVLRQDAASSAANILIHGIGGRSQVLGTEPAEALMNFLDYAGKAPLVAFHAAFDAAFLRQAIKPRLGIDFRPPWLDLALLAPALMPSLAARLHSLDDWSAHFNIANFARHSALADAYSTAQLLLALIELAKQSKNAQNFSDLASLEKAQRTLLRLKE